MSRRTRIVRWLRVLLPLLALVILSTVFLFSGGSDTEPEIPYAEIDAERMARQPRMISPEYAGVTADGAELSLRASEVAPEGEGAGTAQGMRLDFRRADGLAAELLAPEATLADDVITLLGGVSMATSSGWHMTAEQISTATDRSNILAKDGVKATAPFGKLTAGAMELNAIRDKSDSAVLNFTDGVRLIYQP